MLEIATPSDLAEAVAEAKSYTDAKVEMIALTPGPQGEAGPQGPAGADGATGTTGPQGVVGPAGPQGPAGFDGATGPAGPQGATGMIGPVGPVGSQGATGAPGVAGSTGPQGPKGDTGATGPQGIQGEPGPAGPAGSGGGSSYAWEVPLSSFAGSTDDAKLTAALAYTSSQTMKGCTIVLDEAKTYTFSQTRALYSGLSISGPFRVQDQARSSKPLGNQVNIRTTGPWFTLPSGVSTFGVHFQNLSLDGQSGNSLIGGGSGVLWTSVFHNISAQNFGNLFGTTSSKLLNTACTFSGWWNINNVQNRAFVVGGSDTNFAFTECLLDSPSTLLGPTQYLAEFQSQSKCPIQNLYVTAEGHSAFRWTGGADRTVVANSRIEGRNSGAPSPGALVRIEGSDVTFRDCWLSYAMSNPSATGRNDGGVVHVTGGNVLLDGIDYERADGVAESVPVLYASGGKVRVRNVNGRGFTGKPIVRQSVAGLINADDSVTVITG